ncbi:MAG: gliding motility-associated C-terminal domain-containing protein [Bacteroidia bacterium]
MNIGRMIYTPKSVVVAAIGFFVLLFSSACMGQFVVNPGPPQTTCKGDSVTLGGSPTASGGIGPYSYSWTPSANMNNSSYANPRVLITATTWFYVTVIDIGNAGARRFDSVQISLSNVYAVTAGDDTSVCPFTAGATLGGSGNDSASYAYSWTPSNGLNQTNIAHPTALPDSTTTYTLTVVSGGGCNGDTTHVTVTVLASPTITVTSPVTIKEGTTVTLDASGAEKYFWTPADSTILANNGTGNPEVDPIKTTTYTVIGIGADGCPNSAKVLVEVIPDSDLIFYNTFTPNGDGINDTWFVGNIELYPNNSLTVFNRYGKQVYYSQPYANDWAGTELGNELPDATYYYILNTGTGKSYTGAVTIIRKPK